VPVRIPRNTLMIEHKMTALSAAIRYKKVPDTLVPMIPV